MDTPAPSIIELARQLLAANVAPEIGGRGGTEGAGDQARHSPVAVLDSFRTSLTRLAGSDGFSTLLRRALSLAAAQAPALAGVTVSADGRLEGWGQVFASDPRGETGREAALAITSQLLSLLVTFIGRPITMTLIREAWPDLPLAESHPRTEAP